MRKIIQAAVVAAAAAVAALLPWGCANKALQDKTTAAIGAASGAHPPAAEAAIGAAPGAHPPAAEMDNMFDGVSEHDRDKSHGYSVRCVTDK